MVKDIGNRMPAAVDQVRKRKKSRKGLMSRGRAKQKGAVKGSPPYQKQKPVS